MIKCKDFVPEKKKGGIFKSGSMQHFEDVLQEMDSWVAQTNINVVSIETLLLPNIHESDEEGSQDTELWTGGESASKWYQVIRLWYSEG